MKHQAEMQRAAATTRAATALVLKFCGKQGILGVFPLALQYLSMAGEQIPSVGLRQCLNPRVVAAAAAAWQLDPCASLESHPCTSHYNPHPSCLQAPDVPASLAPCLVTARNCLRLFFNPEQVSGLETCWLQTFLPLLKDLGLFLPCKAVCFPFWKA